MEYSLMTNWNDDELYKLCDANNHRIKYTGFDYVWEHNINGKWELHSIYRYKNWKKHYRNLKFWLNQWSRELSDRRVNKSKDCLDSIKNHLKSMEDVIEIANSNMKTSAKIKEILNIMPNETVTFISNVLNVSRQSIHKHLKNKK